MLLVDSFSFLFPKKRKELMIVMRDECQNKMMIVQIESYYSCHHCYSWLLYLALCSCIGTTEEFGRLMGLQN